MENRIGFIGLGAMGSSLLQGLLAGGVKPQQIVAYDTMEAKLREIAQKYQIEAMPDVRTLVKAARVIFVAVKSQDLNPLFKSIGPVMQDGQVIVSVAPGLSIADIESFMQNRVGIIRVMPNTPCLVGEGAMAVCGSRYVDDNDLHMVVSWLQTLGTVHSVPEKLMDAVTGLSGSGPAYVYRMIEAMADGGVLNGIPRAMAVELATQTVLGSAKMVMETGEHPAILRDMVTSPGGTTAEGLFALEENGFAASVQKAVNAATRKSKELGK